MPRANRYYLPGYVWHITHRCHEREHLLKFPQDRRCWMAWLFEARKRYGLTVLNYMVTCNHIHLLVAAGDDPLVIPRSMQLIAGRSGQQFNQRKDRAGAFWEDRYHATAVETGKHLVRCLAYIDLNMVRAGIVGHPQEWPHCGYHEIQNPPQRYRRIDREQLASLLELATVDGLAAAQQGWVASALSQGVDGRHPEWTESIAVGSESFAGRVRAQLGARARYREVVTAGEASVLRESAAAYRVTSGPQIEFPSCDNTHPWRVINS